jgi:hypothetical protein
VTVLLIESYCAAKLGDFLTSTPRTFSRRFSRTSPQW